MGMHGVVKNVRVQCVDGTCKEAELRLRTTSVGNLHMRRLCVGVVLVMPWLRIG